MARSTVWLATRPTTPALPGLLWHETRPKSSADKAGRGQTPIRQKCRLPEPGAECQCGVREDHEQGQRPCRDPASPAGGPQH